MSSPSEAPPESEIIDQAVALSFDFKSRTVEALTQIRVRMTSPSSNELRLHLKQAELISFRIHSVQLYNKSKDKLKRSTLDHKLQSSVQFPTPGELHDFYAKMLAQTPHNIFHFEETCRKIVDWEEQGPLLVRWAFAEQDKYQREMPNIYKKGFCLYLTFELKTRLVEPAGPVFFQRIENKLYFIKDASFGSCRNLFPCQDKMNSFYFFSRIKVTVNDPSLRVICSGKLEEVLKSGALTSFSFLVNKKINPTFLGLTIGEFLGYDAPTFVAKVFAVKSEKENSDFDDILYLCKKYEKYLFNFADDDSALVLVPGLVYSEMVKIQDNRFYNPIAPFFFHGFFLVNSEFFLINKFLESNFSNISAFVKYKFLSKSVEFVRFRDQDALWVLCGISSFLDDVLVHHINGQADLIYFHSEKKRRYFSCVKEGLDRNRLTQPHFCSPNQVYADHGFWLKSNLAFTCIANVLKLSIENYSILFAIFNSEIELTTASFLKALKMLYRIKNLKRQICSIIDFSGTLRLDLNYHFNRKDNKLHIGVRQVPLAQAYFARSNKKRLEVEKFFNAVSEANKLVERIQTGYRSLVASFKGLVGDKALAEADSVVLANSARFALKQWTFSLPVLVIESSSEGYKAEIYTLELNDKEVETGIQLKARFRRNANKKTAGDAASVTDLQGVQSLGTEGTPGNAGGVSVYDSEIQNSIYYEGAEFLSFKLLVDPDNCFIFEVHSNESESVLIEQLGKGIAERADLAILLAILAAMERILGPKIVSLFLTMLGQKETPIYVKLKILEILEKNREEFLVGRVPDVLVHLIQSIKWDEDGTLKPNNFKDYPQFFYFLKLVRVLLKFDRSLKGVSRSGESTQNDDTIVQLILTLVKKNDNSINPNDDSFYQSFVLKCLLKSVNSRFFDKTCKEILRCIKAEHYNRPRNKYMICVIFGYFARFVVKNMRVQHYRLLKAHSNKFSLLEIFTENSNLKQILDYFRNLKKIYKGNTIVTVPIFRHKLYVKKSVKGYKPADLLIYSLKYIKKMGEKFGPLTQHALLAEFYRFAQKHKSNFEKLQISLNLKNIDLLVHLIWGQMCSGLGMVNPIFRHWYAKLFETIFDEFVPISLVEREKHILFPIDSYWLEITKRINFEKYFTKEKKFITFKYLSLQKKTKKGHIISPPQNSKYNVRDIILQNFKVNKETLTKRNMMKHIVNILLTEKIIMKIENDYLKDEQLSQAEEKGEFTFKIRNNVYSIKEIKRRLLKPEINSLGRLKQEIFTVIDFFKSKNYISEGIYKEYLNFVALLIAEAQKILKEKMEKEEAQNENMKIRLPLRRT